MMFNNRKLERCFATKLVLHQGDKLEEKYFFLFVSGGPHSSDPVLTLLLIPFDALTSRGGGGGTPRFSLQQRRP